MSDNQLDDVTSRLQARWAGMGGKLGLGFATLGFIVIALAWNGAAGLDFTQGQIPYLISGGGIGIGLIILGAAVVVTEAGRRDRQVLEHQLAELNAQIAKMAAVTAAVGATGSAGDGAASVDADTVIVGRRSFHRADCRLAQGRGRTSMPRAVAEAEGLAPCRVCEP